MSKAVHAKTHKATRIEARLDAAEAMARACVACGHRCGVDRLAGDRGVCQALSSPPRHARCASHTLHFGEEPLLVGRGGSGTVFFAHCNLRCVFCQNHQISHGGIGTDMAPDALARVFLSLQQAGAENINLVTPTQYLYPILCALRDAYRDGLAVPLVYNTNAYETPEALALLDGVVDVYLPDLKYMDAVHAKRYSAAKDYPSVAQAAIEAMHRQVGPVVMSDGVATRGLIVRHLVLPHDLAGSYACLLWLKDQGMLDVPLSLMSQYSPQHHARDFPELRDPVPSDDYRAVVDYALELGFTHLLTQEPASRDAYLPDFRKKDPFVLS